MIKSYAAIAVVGLVLSGYVNSLSDPNPVPLVELQAVTFNGQLFIAGVGEDCTEAWEARVLPLDWETITCVER